MPHIRIPSLEDKKWRGIFPGNYAGNLWSTFNVDLERSKGRIGLSDKMRIIADAADADTTSMGVPLKFIRTNADITDRIWGICTAKLINTPGTDPTADWDEDALVNTPTDALDAEIHESANGEQRLVVTRDADIAILNRSGVANAWTATWGSATLSPALALTSGKHHPVARLQRLLAIGDVATNTTTPIGVLHTVDRNDVSVVSRLTFGTGYEPRFIITTRDRFWIGCINIFGAPGKVVEWDGYSLSQNNEYAILGSFPLSGFVVNDVPYVLDEVGYIYRFTGGGFSVETEFPLREEGFTHGTTVTGSIAPHGVAVDRNLAYILTGSNINSRRTRAGVWIFDTITKNLYHHMGLSQHKVAGTDLGYGDTILATTGGIKFFYNQPALGKLVAGAGVYIGNISTTRNAVMISVNNKDQGSNAGRNRGYFITPYLPIAEIEAMWEGLWAKFKRFVNSGNRIIVKYRVLDPSRDQGDSDESVQQKNATWVTTTTFTSIVPTGVVVGNEVEILRGDNSGCSFNISVLSATPDNSATITVTIDEAAPTSSTNQVTVNYDNFLTLGTISSTTVGNQKLAIPRAAHGEFIQLKVETRGFGVEIDELIPFYKEKTLIQQK